MFNRKKIKKIPCYVLVYDQLEIITKTLDFLTRYNDRLEIVVLENPSIRSAQIKKTIDTYGKKGLISRYYRFENNITGNAFEVVLNKESNLISNSPLVLMTDGDLTSKQKDWLSEEISVLNKHTDVFACGISLNLANLPLESFPDANSWLPEDINVYDDYIEVCTGVHMLLCRGYELSGFLKWIVDNKLNFVDSNMHKYCYEVLHKKWARTKLSSAHHLTWDLYSDLDNEYTKLKTSRSFSETWHISKTSSYSFTDYTK